MEADLIGMLLADAPIAAVVSDRIRPTSRVQSEALPSLVVTRISGGPGYADDGEIGLEAARVQIDAWAETYTTAKDLARLVRNKLSAFSGVFGVTNFTYIMLDEERDLREPGANAAEYPFRTIVEFIVHVRG